MTNRDDLIAQLESLAPFDADEAEMRRSILEFVRANEGCYERELLSGHLTGSAWVVDPARERTLLVHHRKLNKWLQPGGHADGETDLPQVALREMREETGADGQLLCSGAVFDVDAHHIPAWQDVPAHVHYDIRFAFEADPSVPLELTEESHEVAWFLLDEVGQLNTDASVMRMVAKTRAGFCRGQNK